MEINNLVIISNFLDRIKDKYPGLIKFDYFTNENNREMVLIKIDCRIDELKDIFHMIRATRINRDGVNIVYYTMNTNRHCHIIQDMFKEINYDLIIEIYNNDFESFDKNIFSVVNLDDIDIFGAIEIV